MKFRLPLVLIGALSAASPVALMASCTMPNQLGSASNPGTGAPMEPRPPADLPGPDGAQPPELIPPQPSPPVAPPPAAPQPPALPEEELFAAAGGRLDNGLEASAYLNLARHLALAPTTFLPNLTNEALSEVLQERTGWVNLEVEITAGDSQTGTLSLRVIGYEGADGFDFTLTGFQTTAAFSLRYSNFVLDTAAWIAALRPIATSSDRSTIAQIQPAEWLRYVQNFEIRDGQSGAYVGNFQQLSRRYFTFALSGTNVQGGIRFKVQAALRHFRFEATGWQPTSASQAINQSFLELTEAPLPTIDDVKRYILAQTTIDQTELSKHYPSWWLAQQRFYTRVDQATWLDDRLVHNPLLDQPDAPLVQRYFGATRVLLGFVGGSIVADDQQNSLSFSLGLIIDGDPEYKITRRFAFSGQTRDFNQLQPALAARPNALQLRPDSTLAKRIIRALKQDAILTAKIEQFWQNPAQWAPLPDAAYISAAAVTAYLSRPLYDPQQQKETHKALMALLAKQFELRLFNEPLKFNYDDTPAPPEAPGQIRFTNQLLNWQNEVFLVEGLAFMPPPAADRLLVEVTKVAAQQLQVRFEIPLILGLSGGHELKLASTFSLDLTQENWRS